MLTPAIKTNRLILRKMTESDYPAFKAYFTHPLTAQYSNIPNPNAHNCKQAFDTNINSEFSWAVCLADSGEVVGDIHFANILELYLADIGYIQSPDFWGNGYMTEAVNAVVDYAFNELFFGRIRAVTMQDNSRSVKLLERCGFVREAAICEGNYGGVVADIFYYSITKLNKI